jgi:hypothetical protein
MLTLSVEDGMRLTLPILALCSLITWGPLPAKADDHIEVFGGYSFVQATVPITTTFGSCNAPVPSCMLHFLTKGNLNGWELAGTLRPGSWFGITADFGGYYGRDTAGPGGSTMHFQTYLVGPKIALPGKKSFWICAPFTESPKNGGRHCVKVSPFGHVLLGVAHAWTGNGYEATGITIPSSGTTFATALGGGIDMKLGHVIGLRPIQIDYLLTRFNPGSSGLPPNSATQNEFRASAGLVVRF